MHIHCIHHLRFLSDCVSETTSGYHLHIAPQFPLKASDQTFDKPYIAEYDPRLHSGYTIFANHTDGNQKTDLYGTLVYSFSDNAFRHPHSGADYLVFIYCLDDVITVYGLSDG